MQSRVTCESFCVTSFYLHLAFHIAEFEHFGQKWLRMSKQQFCQSKVTFCWEGW